MDFNDLMDNALGTVVSTFGQSVTYTPGIGSPFAIPGIYDDKFYEIDQASGLSIMTRSPVLEVQLSAFPSAPAIYDTVLVGSTTYKVTKIEPDGDGGARLHLAKTS